MHHELLLECLDLCENRYLEVHLRKRLWGIENILKESFVYVCDLGQVFKI